jgi:hypothetical protein
MIEKGYRLNTDQGDGTYIVSLGCISLPHLPVSRRVLSNLKLSKKEMVGHFMARGKVMAPAFKLIAVTTSFVDGMQLLHGRIRSCGVGDNYIKYVREASRAPMFDLITTTREHPDYSDVFEITEIKGVVLMDERIAPLEERPTIPKTKTPTMRRVMV